MALANIAFNFGSGIGQDAFNALATFAKELGTCEVPHVLPGIYSEAEETTLSVTGANLDIAQRRLYDFAQGWATEYREEITVLCVPQEIAQIDKSDGFSFDTFGYLTLRRTLGWVDSY